MVVAKVAVVTQDSTIMIGGVQRTWTLRRRRNLPRTSSKLSAKDSMLMLKQDKVVYVMHWDLPS